jgi:hypothetical protein
MADLEGIHQRAGHDDVLRIAWAASAMSAVATTPRL